MNNKNDLGGIIHTYQKYDPVNFPSPDRPAARPGLAGLRAPALLRQHAAGSPRRNWPTPSASTRRRSAGSGRASSHRRDAPRARSARSSPPTRPATAQEAARKQFHDAADEAAAARRSSPSAFQRGGAGGATPRPGEPLLSRPATTATRSPAQLLQPGREARREVPGRRTGRRSTSSPAAQQMTVPKALEVKEELETIDKLLKQLEEAKKTAQIGVIDLEELAEFAEPGDMEQPPRPAAADQRVPARAGRAAGDRAGPQGGFQLTPKALPAVPVEAADDASSSELQASRTGRHPDAGHRRGGGRDAADQAVRVRRLGHAHGHPGVDDQRPAPRRAGLPVRLKPDDIVIHKTRNNPKCATCVLLDMSGSMRYDGQYVNVKRMGLALDGLIRTRVPRRLPAVHRDVHVRQAAARLGGRRR